MRRVVIAVMLVLFATSTVRAEDARVLISGVFIHGFIAGTPTLDSAVRLVNLDPSKPADISDFVLTDKFTPRKQRKGKKPDESAVADPFADPADTKPKRGRPKEDRELRFPAGATIPAGGEIWVAATATGFRQTFGSMPAFEASDTDPKVPNLDPANGFVWLNEGYGTVALLNRSERVVDFVAFQNPKQGDVFPEDAFDEVPWGGSPIDLKADTVYGWTGRVLGRARDEQGRVLPDTDRAGDWPIGFSRMQLGTMPTHRVELAGQSRFVARPLTNVKAKVLATSAPDNNFAAFITALGTAKKELRVRVYELTNSAIADALIKTKKRGVKVLLYLEGSPVGGIADQERWLVDRIAKAGIPVHFLGTPKGSSAKPRYVYDHSKYVLIDDRLAIVGTENYGRSGVPIDNSYGNRGYMVHIENPEFVRQLREVWDQDYRPDDMADIISVDASPNDTYGMPYRDQAFKPSDKVPTGLYHTQAKPVLVDDTMNLELVLSPDTSLNEGSSIMGLIARAKTSLYLEQNSVLPFWGKKKKGDEESDERDASQGPSLPLQAVIAAARRGVRVRVLLDGTWYNAEEGDERDNDNTVRYLNELAKTENLDIAAKVINLESTHLDKIHAKGVIVDDREVFIGSINWSENSFEGNREVGVIVSHPKVAGYYADLFVRDWSQSRLYATPLSAATDVREAPDGTSAVIGKKAKDEKVDVVFEPAKRRGQAWLEVSLGLGKTGFVPAELATTTEVTARESMYVIGRDVTLTDKVVAVVPGEKVTKLLFVDEERAPFVAVVFAKDAPAFGDLTTLVGKRVRMSGAVKVYTVPEIVLSKPEQLQQVP